MLDRIAAADLVERKVKNARQGNGASRGNDRLRTAKFCRADYEDGDIRLEGMRYVRKMSCVRF